MPILFLRRPQHGERVGDTGQVDSPSVRKWVTVHAVMLRRDLASPLLAFAVAVIDALLGGAFALCTGPMSLYKKASRMGSLYRHSPWSSSPSCLSLPYPRLPAPSLIMSQRATWATTSTGASTFRPSQSEWHIVLSVMRLHADGFFSPTHGRVNYVDMYIAQGRNLTYTTGMRLHDPDYKALMVASQAIRSSYVETAGPTSDRTAPVVILYAYSRRRHTRTIFLCKRVICGVYIHSYRHSSASTCVTCPKVAGKCSDAVEWDWTTNMMGQDLACYVVRGRE